MDTREVLDFELLAKHSSAHVRAAVAVSPEIPYSVLCTLAADEEASVRAAAVLNSARPIEWFHRLTDEPNPRIRLGLSTQLEICEDVLLVLAKHKNPYLARQAEYALAGMHFEQKLQELKFIPVVSTEYKIGELLVDSNQLSRERLDDALGLSETFQLKLGRLLLQLGWVRASVLVDALIAQSLLRQGRLENLAVVQRLANSDSNYFPRDSS